jgi:hypothetical protein
MISERNYSQIDESDLRVLLNNSKTVLHKYFYSSKGNKWLDLYDINNPICVALCQGAAMHYFDKTNGIKDFDIWFFYQYNHKHLPYRGVFLNWDYQNSKFGRHPDFDKYDGRKVDILIRSIKYFVNDNPIETIYKYFENERTKTSIMLSKKAVVLLEPDRYFGKVIWYKKPIITS